ncbi:TetR/AcrR family transcriptional regulator [Streptomyces mangrovisoli]|uniref:HTH tetR-type domain-containing protein n=1 Tax=Streptomyces mangrovisoli TaxID=1428628 RepID=A0A1J4NT67_9ACTN|nr:TetR/AcrR family transcriptional regulator [Streptomyces mangrovisoli]OIJ65298.1 hypothetical protein WN71_023725 [Streptomyces mangrovisoli]
MVITTGAATGGPGSGKPWSHQTAKKRAAILTAAVTVFVREGFAAASVDEIAAQAGVGKQTVYNYFGDKQQLFLAAIQRSQQGEADSDSDSGGDPAAPESAAAPGADASPPARLDPAALFPLDRDPYDVLTDLGRHILDAVLDPDRAALHRLTIAELERHPELQRMWRDTASGGIIAALARYLAELGDRGRLAVDEPDLTARQFAVLLAAEGRTRSLHGLHRLDPDERRLIAEQTAALILRASRPNKA